MYKPDSVPHVAMSDCHLSRSAIADTVYLSTHKHRASHPQAFTYLTFQHTRFTPIIRYRIFA